MNPPMVQPLVYSADTVLAALAPAAALVLAAVFAFAAATKSADAGRTGDEFARLGLPAPDLLARVVPPAEAVVALTLLWRPALGSTLATFALLAFTAVLGAALRTGRNVTCGCLGSFSRKPISALTLARNAELMALAALASTTPATGGLRPTLPATEMILSLGLAAMLAAVAVQLVMLREQIGRIWSVELAGEHTERRTSTTKPIDEPERSNP